MFAVVASSTSYIYNNIMSEGRRKNGTNCDSSTAR